MMKTIANRLTRLEAARQSIRLPYHQAREQALRFWGDLHKVYGQGTLPTEESVNELTRIIMAGQYEAWIAQQIKAVYERASYSW
jgi:hypothetical protein